MMDSDYECKRIFLDYITGIKLKKEDITCPDNQAIAVLKPCYLVRHELIGSSLETIIYNSRFLLLDMCTKDFGKDKKRFSSGTIALTPVSSDTIVLTPEKTLCFKLGDWVKLSKNTMVSSLKVYKLNGVTVVIVPLQNLILVKRDPDFFGEKAGKLVEFKRLRKKKETEKFNTFKY